MADDRASAKQAPLAGVTGLWFQVALGAGAICQALAAYVVWQRSSQVTTLLTRADSRVARDLQASANWPDFLNAATAVAVIVAIVLGVLWTRERRDLAERQGTEPAPVTSMAVRLATLLVGLAIVAATVLGRGQVTALVGLAPVLRWQALAHLLLALLLVGAVVVVARADRQGRVPARRTGDDSSPPPSTATSPPDPPAGPA